MNSNIGKATKFRYGNKILKGKIIDEVQLETKGKVAGKYCDVIQLIKLDDGDKVIRFGFYKMDENGIWRWGRAALWEELAILKKLFKKAMEKEWFKELVNKK